MAKNDSKNIPDVKLPVWLFTEIASSAAEIKDLCFHLGDGGRDVDSLEMQIRVMEKFVSRMGWMADLGCKKLTGAESVLGDAEQWLMFPAYVQALQSMEA